MISGNKQDKQLSFDLFLGPVQFCSVQAGVDSMFTKHHHKDKLVVSYVNFQDLESSNSGDVTAVSGRLHYRLDYRKNSVTRHLRWLREGGGGAVEGERGE